jgi:hypothetical protein
VVAARYYQQRVIVVLQSVHSWGVTALAVANDSGICMGGEAGYVKLAVLAELAVVTVVFAGLAGPAEVPGAQAQTVQAQTVPAQARAVTVPTPACHGVVFPASATGSWVIPGGGVDVLSNGPADEGTDAACSASLSRINGQAVGREWQWVELINRLYLHKAWIKAPASKNQVPWSGCTGSAFYANTPSNLAKQANAAVSYLGPGDVVVVNVFDQGKLDGGRALVVNDTSDVVTGTVNLVSQNSGLGAESAPVVSGVIAGGRVTVGGAASGYSYTTVGVVHAPAAPVTTWTATKAPLPANAATSDSPGLTGVSCPSATVCVAVGNYEAKPSGESQGLLVTRSGSSWKAAEAPLPANANAKGAAVQLFGVACPSATVCVAVGSYTASSQSTEGVLLTWHGSAWTAAQAPLPGDAASDPSPTLTDVTCPSATSCVVAGVYIDSASVAQGVLLAEHGSSWSATQAPMPAGAVGRPVSVLSQVACPVITTCVVTGVYSNALRSYQGLLLTGHGSSWSASKAPVPPGFATDPDPDITDVQCASATACLATGSYLDSTGNEQGLLLARHGSSWSAREAPRPAGAAAAQPASLVEVACPAAACVAVGEYTASSGTNQGLLLTGSGSSWAAIRAPLPAGGAASKNADLAYVACPAAASCAAAGAYTDRSGNQLGLLLARHGTSWAATKAPLPAGTTLSAAPTFTDLACLPASCAVTGSYTDSSGHQQALLLTGPA